VDRVLNKPPRLMELRSVLMDLTCGDAQMKIAGGVTR
jgi:hypothetical protein